MSLTTHIWVPNIYRFHNDGSLWDQIMNRKCSTVKHNKLITVVMTTYKGCAGGIVTCNGKVLKQEKKRKQRKSVAYRFIVTKKVKKLKYILQRKTWKRNWLWIVHQCKLNQRNYACNFLIISSHIIWLFFVSLGIFFFSIIIYVYTCIRDFCFGNSPFIHINMKKRSYVVIFKKHWLAHFVNRLLVLY